MGQRAGRLWRKIWKRFCRKGECSLLFMNRGSGIWKSVKVSSCLCLLLFPPSLSSSGGSSMDICLRYIRPAIDYIEGIRLFI